MNFLFDHNLPPYLARSIDEIIRPAFDQRAFPKRDKFPIDTPDVDWMTALGREGGWCFISDDHRIRRSTAERIAFRRARITGFVLDSGFRKLRTIEKTARLLLQWELITKQAEIATGGSMFELRAKGRQIKPLPV